MILSCVLIWFIYLFCVPSFNSCVWLAKNSNTNKPPLVCVDLFESKIVRQRAALVDRGSSGIENKRNQTLFFDYFTAVTYKPVVIEAMPGLV